MISKSWILLYATMLFVTPTLAEGFDCHVSTNGLEFDLTPLQGEHTASSEARNSPPTSFKDTARINLCEDLKSLDGTPAEDQVGGNTAEDDETLY
jgi:hypothetical protein